MEGVADLRRHNDNDDDDENHDDDDENDENDDTDPAPTAALGEALHVLPYGHLHVAVSCRELWMVEHVPLKIL